MDRIAAEQARRNRDAREGWNLYAGHRQRVTQGLVTSSPGPAATLCVLGAGNCNDLDLQRLKHHFSAIYLLDLDGDALALGCEQQGVAGDPAIQLHGGVDVTDVAAMLETWSPQQPPSDPLIMAVMKQALMTSVPGLPRGPFDVVASVGLLTQLIEMVDVTLGPRHPRFVEVMSAVRLRHLRLLLELTKPGGKAWLLTEVVSSLTCSELLTTAEADLLPVLQRAIVHQNFFTGVNPAILNRLFREDPWLARQVSQLEMPPPWLWNFFTRTYAVCPFVATRRGE